MERVKNHRYRNGKGRKPPVPERKGAKTTGTGMERVQKNQYRNGKGGKLDGGTEIVKKKTSGHQIFLLGTAFEDYLRELAGLDEFAEKIPLYYTYYF